MECLAAKSGSLHVLSEVRWAGSGVQRIECTRVRFTMSNIRLMVMVMVMVMAMVMAACGLAAVSAAGGDSSKGNELQGRRTIEFSVLGMACENCAKSAKGLLSKVPGVVKASVNFNTKAGRIETSGRVSKEQVSNALSTFGFEAQFAGEQSRKPLSKEVLSSLDIKTITHGKAIRIRKHLAPGKITIFDYYADWCGPCHLLTPKLERLVQRYENVALRKVDVVDWESKVARQATRELKLQGLPFTRIFDDKGNLLGQVMGNSIAKIEEIVGQYGRFPKADGQ